MRIYLNLLLLFAILLSCVENNNPDILKPGLKNNEIDVTLVIQLPVHRKPLITYALSDKDETNIKTVDVLVFKVDNLDNTKEYFAYKTIGTNITEEEDPNTKKFKVTLLTGGTDQYRLVVLANSQTEIANLGDIQTTELKDDILSKLLLTKNEKWITNKLDPSYRDIPMWGESKQIRIDKNLGTVSGIRLTRMLARIDVILEEAAQANFKLNSIRLYNYNTSALIAPFTDPIHWDGQKSLQPSIPEYPGRQLGPLVYDQIPYTSVIREIYTFESASLNQTRHPDATCLVIGGEFNNEGKETFFRIDFMNTDLRGNATFLNLLRNHLYSIRISEVKGAGYETPAEAFASESSNINTEITVWDKGKLSEIVFDEQYMLGVSSNTFEFPLSSRTEQDTDNRLIVYTDHENGWHIESIVDQNNKPVSWLSATQNTGESITMNTISLILQTNDTEMDRTAYIHFRAGRLKCTVEVKQNTIPELGLKITNGLGQEIEDMLFNSHVGGSVPPQELNILWIPSHLNNFVSVIPVAGTSIFSFGSGNAITPGYILDANGYKKYVIQPPAMTQSEIDSKPFLEKALRIDFTVGNGVSYESKALFLLQKNYAAVPKVESSYLMDGNIKTFIINANAPWRIEITNDPQNIIQELYTTWGGQYEDKRDEIVSFRIKDDITNPSIFNGEVTFTIKPTNARRPFSDKVFTIQCRSTAFRN